MAPAPWASVPDREQFFVLVTGANSGIGLGIAQRLIDEFFATRPLTSHLILLPTTRSVRKSRETVKTLRGYASQAVESKTLRSRGATTPQDAISRIHILSPQLDLCDLPGVYDLANTLLHRSISNPPSESGVPDPLTNLHIPRLDAVIFNAGYGGWHGLDFPGAVRMLFRDGIVQSATWPDFKVARPGAVLTPRPRRSDLVPAPPSPLSPGSAYDTKEPADEKAPALGEVFCANVFGHYCFAHALLPLLCRTEYESRSRAGTEGLEPGRIIWTSSIEPAARHFSLEDMQGVETEGPYESSKRLTDVLALTAELPAASRFAEGFFRVEDPVVANARTVKPRMYLTHPGVVASTLFPLSAFLFFWYKFALYIARWLGSPWHVVDGYRGAVAPAWVAMTSQEELDAMQAQKVKWGSSCGRDGKAQVKKTEVEGWGWDGAVVDREALKRDTAKGIHRMRIGRSGRAIDTTKESREAFEALGAACWKEMEKLRVEWEENLGIGSGES